jgi:IclR family mhp operon transcriptional activator
MPGLVPGIHVLPEAASFAAQQTCARLVHRSELYFLANAGSTVLDDLSEGRTVHVDRLRHANSNMQGKDEKRSDGIRSIQRGLDVLTEVNRSGGIRPGELAQRLQLARPTVYRLLETLEELGYVRRGGSDDRFRVTRKASSLGDGYDPGLTISEAAMPVIGELSKRFVWPVDLSIYENAAMVVQETTHAQSPLSIDRGMIGRRLPMLRTSAGRAYLAFCPQAEREIIIKHLSRIDDPDDRPFLDRRLLDKILAETRTRGYGVRVDGEYNNRTSSIAVPIVRSADVLGCISIIWIRTAIDPAEAMTQFAAPLLKAAAQLGATA